MARRIQSQIIQQTAVRPLAPVAPTGLADIGQLIAGITRAGTTLAQAEGRAFQQERQVGAIERQADAAEARVEQAQVDQDTLELQIESNQNRLLTAEAKTEMARLTRLERLGFQAVVEETPDDELPALYAEFPLSDPANQDAFARLIGARAATADETNLLKRLGESQLAQRQAGAEAVEGPPLPLDQSVSDMVLALKEERAFDEPLIAAVYEQQLTSMANSFMKNVVVSRQKLQSDELANSAIDENLNVTYRALEEVFAGEQGASSIRDLVDNTFPVVNAAIPSHGKSEHLDTFAAIVDDWAKSAPDLKRALVVVSDISNLGEQYQRRLRGLKADLTDAVKRQDITRETTRVTNIVGVAQLKIVELGTEGSQSFGRLKDLRKEIETLPIPEVEMLKLVSRADKELAQLERSRGEQIQLDRILAGESSGMVSASAMAAWWKNHPEISPEAKLALFASKDQLIPRVAVDEIEQLTIQAPAESARIIHTLEAVSRTAAGNLIKQMRVPGVTKALVNSTRGLDEDDPLFKQIIDGFSGPEAFQLYIGAQKQLGGQLPTMLDEEGNQIIFQIDDAKFPQNRLIERFLLSPDTQIDPSVLEDFAASFTAGWMVTGTDVTFAGAHPRDKIEFAREFAVSAIERRYALVGQRDGTRQFVRRDLLGDPNEDDVSAISRRMTIALQDQELDFGTELSIAWDSIQPIGKTSLIPIGGIAVTEDSEGPQFVAFIELDHATGLTRTISAVTDPGGFDEARLLFGDASKRLDPTIRLNWTPDKGSAIAVSNPEFLAVVGPDMLREGQKAWVELVGGRPETRPGDFGTFMDDFLRTHNWTGAFPRPLLLQSLPNRSLTGIPFGTLSAGTQRNILRMGGLPNLPNSLLGNKLSRAATPLQFGVEPGTDISLVPAAMREFMELANGDPELAAKLARDAEWVVPETDN